MSVMRRRLFPLLALTLTLAGCAARRPAAWRFVPEGRGHRLIPPRAHPGRLDFALPRARAATLKNPACRLDQPGIRLEWMGRTARVRADAAPLAPLPGTVLESAGGGAPAHQAAEMIVRSNWFVDSLKPGLIAQRQAGCLAEDDIAPLTRRIVDHLALPTSASYRLLYGEYADRGFLDIDARFRLRAVEPIRQQGQVAGYLTSFYLLSPAPGGGAVASPGHSESNIRSVITRGTAPDHELLHLPARSTHFRFFFRTWSVSEDRRIALLAAPSEEALAQATPEFEAAPDSFCAGAARQDVSCISVPRETVIGPELRVRANGRDEFVPVGGNLGDLFRVMEIRDAAKKLSTLRIRRPFEGALRPVEFDRTSPSILGLVLIGGEEITW